MVFPRSVRYTENHMSGPTSSERNFHRQQNGSPFSDARSEILEARNKELERVAEEKTLHISDLKAAHERQISEKEQRINDKTERINDLKADHEKERETYLSLLNPHETSSKVSKRRLPRSTWQRRGWRARRGGRVSGQQRRQLGRDRGYTEKARILELDISKLNHHRGTFSR